MRRSLNRKRVLLHDTLNSNLKNTYEIDGYETKDSEAYTIDLLKKAEQKDLEIQMKFLEDIAKSKDAKSHNGSPDSKKINIKDRLRK